MSEDVHDILVNFDPLRITLPGAGPFVGKVRIILPEVHVKLKDLSMGIGLLEGAHIGADGRLWSLDIPNIPEPGMTADQVTEFISGAETELKRMWEVIQEEMDQRYLLD